MTTSPPASPQPHWAPAPEQPHMTTAPAKRVNVLGFVALGLAALGFILACVPGIMIAGWILLPVAFILGIVAICLRGRSKWAGITALIVSVVGPIVSAIVFISVVATAVDDAFTGGDTVVTAPQENPEITVEDAEDPSADEGSSAEAPSAEGTREEPLAFDSVIENNDWVVSFTDFNADANQEVAEGNMFNDEPGDGQQYVIVSASATYQGDGEGSSMMVEIDYVTAGGEVISTWDSMVSGLEPEFGKKSLYAGASDEGKLAFLVPSSLDGLLRVSPGLFADDQFFQLP